MKKSLLILCAIILGSMSSANAGARFGLNVGAYLPTGDAADIYTVSPGLNLVVVASMNEKMSIEGNAGMWILTLKSEYKDPLEALGYELTTGIIPVTGGIRYGINPNLHLDGGAGYYLNRFVVEDKTSGETFSEGDDVIGAYFGAGYTMGKIDISGRVHLPDFSDPFVGLSVGFLLGK